MSSTSTTPGLIQQLAGSYRRFRHVLHEGAKFLIVGLIGVGVFNLVFIPLHGSLGLGPLTSVTIAMIVATAVTFLTTNIDNVIAVNLGIGLGTLFRFWSYRKWVWVPPEIRLAQLRRGRHRKGRPHAGAAASEPALAAARRPRAAHSQRRP